MPTVTIRIPEKRLDQEAKDRLAKGVTEACARAESIPDEAPRRIGIWVLIDEVIEGSWYAAGRREAVAAFIPVIAEVRPPEGVLDDQRRSVMTREITAALDAAVATDGRHAQTPVVMLDVPEGHWGVRDQILRLKDHARLWGYAHLQHLVREPAGQPEKETRS